MDKIKSRLQPTTPGKVIKLSEQTEENVSFFAKMLDHDYTTKEVFRKNFFDDLRKVGALLQCAVLPRPLPH